MKKRTKTVARRPPRAVAGLEALRQEIDAVDQRIQALIAARAGLAQQVAVVKGGKGSAAIIDATVARIEAGESVFTSGGR